MRLRCIKKSQVRTIFSLGVLGFFLVIAIGSIEEVFILDMLEIDVEPWHKYNPETENFERSYKWSTNEIEVWCPRDRRGIMDGKFMGSYEYVNKENGDTMSVVEKGIMLDGLRYGACKSDYALIDDKVYYSSGIILRYYIAGCPVSKSEYETWFEGGELPPGIEINKGRAVGSSSTAWERLGERYPWFVLQLQAFGFDSLYQENYLDTLELILQANTFEADEFDDYYELAIEDLKETTYDSIIQINGILAYLQGLDIVARNELRLAVLDRYYLQAGSTYDVIAEHYPGYLDLAVNEGEVPETDFALFCEKLDSAMNSYGLLDLEDPFFVDSVDARIYRALFAIMDSGEDGDLKTSLTPYHSNSRNPSFLQKVHSLMAREREQRISSTPSEVAEMVLYTLVMAYFDGDLMKESVMASWYAHEGIALPPESLTSFYAHLDANSVALVAYVYSDGGAEVSERGFVWASHHNPTLADHSGSMGSGTGFFKMDVPGLTEGEAYYARSYATNTAGTSYGNSIAFTAEESSGTGMTDSDQATLRLYPNPALSFVRISCSNTIPGNCRVQVTDLQGQLCLDEKAGRMGPGGEEIVLDISRLGKGAYVCRLLLESGETFASRMLIVAE